MKKCPICNTEVKGRTDKIFCSLPCKSAFQYEKRVNEEVFYFRVDKQLKINRKILKKYNQGGYTTLRKEKLLQEGFNPRFFTHYWKNAEKQVYLFCYEYGFMELEQKNIKKYLLVKWQPYMEKQVKR